MTWKVCRMTMRKAAKQNLIDSLEQMSAPELRRLLAEHLTRQKLGLHWERDAIEHDRMLNADVVLPRLVPEWSHTPEGCSEHRNLIIEGDNFDSLRLLRSTHAGKVRVIYIDPPATQVTRIGSTTTTTWAPTTDGGIVSGWSSCFSDSRWHGSY
jgi:hypothetical protein